MNGFLEEVKRRKVYRVAAAYVIAAGGIIQLASAAFPAWELPNWAIRLVVVLLLLGFPIALILAWAYEFTPAGIKRTEEIAPDKSTTPSRSQRAAPPSEAPEKSIAVLPFENLSDDRENAYFADGVH